MKQFLSPSLRGNVFWVPSQRFLSPKVDHVGNRLRLGGQPLVAPKALEGRHNASFRLKRVQDPSHPSPTFLAGRFVLSVRGKKRVCAVVGTTAHTSWLFFDRVQFPSDALEEVLHGLVFQDLGQKLLPVVLLGVAPGLS